MVKIEDGGPVMTGAFAVCPACVVHYDRNLAIRKVTDTEGKPVEAARLDFLALGPDWKFYAFPLDVKKAWTFSAEGLLRGKPQRFDVAVAGDGARGRGRPRRGRSRPSRWSARGASRREARPIRFTDVVWFAPKAKFPVKFQSSRSGVKPGELSAYTVK